MEDILSSLIKVLLAVFFVIISISSKNKNKHRRNKGIYKEKKLNTLSYKDSKSQINDFKKDELSNNPNTYETMDTRRNKNDRNKTAGHSYEEQHSFELDDENNLNGKMENEDSKYNKENNSQLVKDEIKKNEIGMELNLERESLIKGIIISELLSKPKSLQRR